jgi:hypothetical protein
MGGIRLEDVNSRRGGRRLYFKDLKDYVCLFDNDSDV